MNDKNVKTSELFSCDTFYLTEFFARHEYPWEMLPGIGELAAKLIENPPKGFSLLAPGILVGEGVTIHESAVLQAPVILGEGCTVRPGAYLRGNVIAGKGCVIGNSTEVKNAILLDFAQVPHYNYVGDSILGNRAHMGAGAVCSNLKADGLPVIVRGKMEYKTGLRKFGAILGDRADIGCGCVLKPGTVIGRNTSVYPLTSVRGVVPANCIVKGASNIVEREERRICAE